MRLLNFQTKNYRSIVDSGIVKISELDNVTVLAGQNESGKSSLLSSLYDFEEGDFKEDSLPFSIDRTPVQSVSCTYKIEDESLGELLSEIIADDNNLELADGENILDSKKVNRITEITLTRVKQDGKLRLEVDKNTFDIFKASILDKLNQTPLPEGTTPPTEPVKQKYLDIPDDGNEQVAVIFWKITPMIVFFDDFCDLLPDRISVDALKTKKTDSKGYHAVKNLEEILGIDLVSKDSETDPVRRTKEQKNNDMLSIDFQKDWGQRIHGENKVLIKYNFEKRNGEGENGSYVNFFVETKEGQPLPPKQRSKGLIWFLSLWLELRAQDNQYPDLVLLLDEPDQHLHVRAQKDILKLINKLAKGNKTKGTKGDQIIYATHSPYLIEIDFLNRIKLVLNSEKLGTQVEDISTSKINTEYKRDALQPIADAIGLSVSEFSTLQKKNVLVEGISDFYYFMAMRKMLTRNTDYYFIPGIGVRQINNLISICIGYGLEWIAIIDDDPTVGGKDSKKKIDEIKDYIFDGDESKTKEKVNVLENITGIENMFTAEDLKLVDPKVGKNVDKSKAVGDKRKVLFGRLFFEKAEHGEITINKISQTAKDNFGKVFDFIDKVYPSTKTV